MFSLLFVSFSCKKAPIPTESKTPFAYLSSDSASDPGWIQPILDSYSNSQSPVYGIHNFPDNDDENVNTSIFLTAVALLRMCEDSTFKSAIATKGYYDVLNEVLVDTFLLNADFSFTDFETYTERFGLYINEPNCNYQRLVDLMNHPTGQYYPNLFILNPQVEFNGDIIIAVGELINEDDEIVGWKHSKSGEVTQVIFNPDTFETTYPVIIINNGIDKTGLDLGDSSNDPPTSRSNGHYIADEYKINHRYEKNGKSDFYSCTRGQVSGGGFYNNGEGYKIKSLSANEIGVMFYADVQLYSAGSEGALQTSYERDGYASKKPVTVPGWTTLSFFVRMKYNNEYYQRFYMDFTPETPVSSSDKGLLKIKF